MDIYGLTYSLYHTLGRMGDRGGEDGGGGGVGRENQDGERESVRKKVSSRGMKEVEKSKRGTIKG